MERALQARFPDATQNVSGADAVNLIKNGCVLVCEGANMPSPQLGSLQAGLAFGPASASSGGQGASTSQLEMVWTPVCSPTLKVDAKLKNIKANTKAAHETAEEFGVPGNVSRRQRCRLQGGRLHDRAGFVH